MGVKRRGLSSKSRSYRSGPNEPARLRKVKVVRQPAATGVAGKSFIPATKAKNNFGRILESVLQGGRVVITKHDMPKAILISMDEFNELSGAMELALGSLRGEFDALFVRMQNPGARGAMKSAFHASSKELGKAAVLAARKRG
jgi:antitoxin Phd